MSKNRNILLTFDYEPYLGSTSGSSEKCILQPTNALRGILNKYDAKAIFFVDVLYIFNLKKKIELHESVNSIIAQLKTLYAEGHYIFPHIHPHWLDATYLSDKKQFSLINLSHYSLVSLGSQQIENLFKESICFLKEIGISYPKWGYRAGGWCIQPFNLFRDVFIAEGIMYEFSVLPGYKNDNQNQAFDFSLTKTNQPYLFLNDVEKEDLKGKFVEFPISTVEFNKLDLFKDKLVRKYLWKMNDRGWGDGTSAQTAALKSNFINREMISIDVLTIAKLNRYKKYLASQNYMHWISHPKMFTKHGLKVFDSFLKFGTSDFNLTFDFEKMMPNNN
ncbi:MAG TPA: hypothetical protein VK835_09920 [Bacteroidia bacterium]|jgi:hypothetical protein|nr:hypothetical protein [Bacteroidia bacterium]